MYQKIMVPLDGSKLAESVLPHVEEIARGCGAGEVVLVSVTERLKVYRRSAEYGGGAAPLSPATGPMAASMLGTVAPTAGPILPPEGRSTQPSTARVPQVVGKKERQADRYLNRIARRLEKKGVQVRTEVLLGNPAEEIAHYAGHDGCDLIVMASHGRSGPSRWAYGSVADKVFRASPVPVLMVKAPGSVPGA
jgi:nucleotide-binding universal stress UspA family protein